MLTNPLLQFEEVAKVSSRQNEQFTGSKPRVIQHILRNYLLTHFLQAALGFCQMKMSELTAYYSSITHFMTSHALIS